MPRLLQVVGIARHGTRSLDTLAIHRALARSAATHVSQLLLGARPHDVGELRSFKFAKIEIKHIVASPGIDACMFDAGSNLVVDNRLLVFAHNVDAKL